jgi:hypothetical protein
MIGAYRVGLGNHNMGSRRRSRQNALAATLGRFMAGAGSAVVWPECPAVASIGAPLFALALRRVSS